MADTKQNKVKKYDALKQLDDFEIHNICKGTPEEQDECVNKQLKDVQTLLNDIYGGTLIKNK